MGLDKLKAESPCLFNGLNLYIGTSLDCISSIVVLGVHLDLDHDSKEDLFFSIEELNNVRVSSLFLL